jgi:uncharacterized protein (TIGR02246 family)
MMTRSLVFGLCALAALAVAGPTEKVPSGHTRMIPTGADPRLLSAITKANTDFEIAMTKADTASIAAPYTPDAVFVSPDGTATKGRARIEQLYRDRFAKSGPVLEARIESEQLMFEGGFAYERGRGALTRLEKARRVTDWARFLTIWQRQTDGDWKIFRNVVLPGQ